MPPASKLLSSSVHAAFLLLVLSLGSTQPLVQIRSIRIVATDLIFVVAFGLWLAAIIFGRLPFRLERYHFPLGIYLFALLLSAIFSQDPTFSFFKLAGETYLVCLALLTGSVLGSLKIFRWAVLTWIAGAAVVGLLGAVVVLMFYVDRTSSIHYYFLHHYGSLQPGNYPRIQVTFLYPAMLCNYLTVSLLLLAAAFRLRWVSSKVFGIVSAAIVVTSAFTLTPGLGGVLLAVSLWSWLLLHDQGKPGLAKLSLTTGSAAAASFLVVSAFTLRNIPTSPFFFTVLETRIDPTQRLLTWIESFQTFLSYPIFGKGLGLAVAEVRFLSPSGMQMLTDAHQMWLNVAGQAGVPGLIGILLISFYYLRLTLPWSLATSTAVLRTALGISFTGAFLYQGLTGSFENARPMWVMIGMIIATVSHDFERPETEGS